MKQKVMIFFCLSFFLSLSALDVSAYYYPSYQGYSPGYPEYYPPEPIRYRGNDNDISKIINDTSELKKDVDGYNGIPWGIDLSSIKSQKLIPAFFSANSSTIKYLRSDRPLKNIFSGVETEFYIFKNNKFDSVEITTIGFETFREVSIYLSGSYGYFEKSTINRGEYKSFSTTTDVTGKCDPTTQKGFFVISSSSTSKKNIEKSLFY